MEIGSATPSTLNLVKNSPNQQTLKADKELGSPSTPAIDRSSEQNDGDRDDTVNLSSQSQQLAKAATQVNTVAVSPINSSEQAQKAVSQLVTDIKNHANDASYAYNGVSASQVRNLLG